MEALGHFIFELFKIAMLSCIYTGLFFLGRLIFLQIKKRDTEFRWGKFKQVHIIIYVLLFIFSFTYYGDHGLGDSYSIPLGRWETMEAGDLYAYFIPKGTSNQIPVNAYTVKDGNLCADIEDGYMVYNLKTKKVSKFGATRQYSAYALTHDLPEVDQFLKFEQQYNSYWNGWRFWLLP